MKQPEQVPPISPLRGISRLFMRSARPPPLCSDRFPAATGHDIERSEGRQDDRRHIFHERMQLVATLHNALLPPNA